MSELSPTIVPLWIVIGICLAAGLHHLFVAFRRDSGATNFAFAMVCFAIALYAASNIGLYTAQSAEIYRFYLKTQIGVAFLSGIALLWFIAFYTNVRPWPLLGLMTAYSVGIIVYHFSLPYGIFFSTFEGIREVRLAWGGSVHVPVVEYASWRTHWGDLNTVAQIVFIVAACALQYRRGERRAALLLAVCIAIYFGASIHDVVLARHILGDRPEVIGRMPIQEYGFVSLVLLMSFRLSNEVLKAASIRQALIESEQNLRITLDSIGDAVISTDARGCVTRMNPVAVSLTGWAPEEALGRPLPEIFRIVNSRTRETVPNPAQRVLETGGLVGLANHTLLIHRDGSERQIADSGAPIRDGQGRIVGVVLVFRDVTRQYILEDQLRHSQKMEAVGRLAGGVAHDFNNLLQAIQGYTSLALSQVGDGGRTRNDLREVLKTSDRATHLVRQLLMFSRRESFQPGVTDLNHLVSELTNLLRRVIGVNIELKLQFDAGLFPVQADRGQIEQVLMNLCVNARDAIPDQGEIGIRTENVDLDEAFCLHRAWASPGRYARISVTDNGIGMAPELQGRIFEPYFTTKQRGEGTGLGLATVFAIVERHEGLIEVVSAPGEGSTFRIYLPALAAADEREIRSDAEDRPGRGSGTVLLAEDEEVVRNLSLYVLENAGFTVLVAEDGEIARDLFDRRHRDIDIAVLDLMMPRLGGRAVYDHIRRSHADLPVIFCTGYTPEGLDQLIEQDRRTRLLQKPHPSEALLAAIRSVMDEVERV